MPTCDSFSSIRSHMLGTCHQMQIHLQYIRNILFHSSKQIFLSYAENHFINLSLSKRMKNWGDHRVIDQLPHTPYFVFSIFRFIYRFPFKIWCFGVVGYHMDEYIKWKIFQSNIYLMEDAFFKILFSSYLYHTIHMNSLQIAVRLEKNCNFFFPGSLI